MLLAHAVSWLAPSLSLPTWATQTAVVGEPPSTPPYTYRRFPLRKARPSARVPGMVPAVVGCQAWRTPFVSMVDFQTVLTGPEALRPPTRNNPSAAAASEAPSRASSSFRSSFGSFLPVGSGQGRPAFSGGQKFTGETALIPRSMVGLTVK